MVWSGSIFEPSRLMAIDSLGKITVQERILDIELVNRPLTGRCKVKVSPPERKSDGNLLQVVERTLVQPIWLCAARAFRRR
jgi:hypothetical protein